MSAIINFVRYTIGAMLAMIFLGVFFIAAVITFFVVSAYSSVFFSYFFLMMPFRIMTRSFEDARQQSKETFESYIKVIHACLNAFHMIASFFIAALAPFFKKLNMGYST